MSNTSGKPTIFVSSCDGYSGTATVNSLLALGPDRYASVKLGCENKDEAHDSLETAGAKNVSICEIHPEKLDDLKQVLDGVTTLALIPPTRSRKHQVAINMIQAAEQCGVQNAVLLSWTGTHVAEGGSGKHDSSKHEHLAAWQSLERAFLDSKIPNKAVVRANFYTQNLFTYARQLVRDGTLPLPTKQGAWAPLDAQTLGKALAQMLAAHPMQSTYRGQVLTLTGPEALTGQQMAELLGKALGKDAGQGKGAVTFKDISLNEARSLLASATPKLDKTEIETLVETYDLIAKGVMSHTSKDLEQILDLKHPSFLDTIKRDKDVILCLAGDSSA
ncbi:hypothetical protein H9P43_004377 [Blastocladiella emersonii ATCC 22665]|nr:hypothetical protein H9P43_004377 [Blastocladiella emersonii ATCC 22665]